MATVKYTVVKGDTLSKIAQKHGTTVSAIQKANSAKIKNVNVLSVGWVLNIPVPNSSNGSETIKAQYRKALNDIQNLPSVKKLLELLEG